MIGIFKKIKLYELKSNRNLEIIITASLQENIHLIDALRIQKNLL